MAVMEEHNDVTHRKSAMPFKTYRGTKSVGAPILLTAGGAAVDAAATGGTATATALQQEGGSSPLLAELLRRRRLGLARMSSTLLGSTAAATAARGRARVSSSIAAGGEGRGVGSSGSPHSHSLVVILHAGSAPSPPAVECLRDCGILEGVGDCTAGALLRAALGAVSEAMSIVSESTVGR